MNRLLRFLNKLKGRDDEGESGENLAALRLEFRTRYHNFKLLLQANNKALENMGSIEKALKESSPFNMQFVRGKATAITVDVFRMIRNLAELTNGKYKELDSRFDDLQLKITQLLKSKLAVPEEPLVISLEQIGEGHSPAVGNKMARVGEIKNTLGLAVPDGFVITAGAYQKVIDANNLQTEIDRRFQTADFDDLEELQRVSRDIQKLVEEAELPGELSEAILSAFDCLEKRTGTDLRVALRSSALGEDLKQTSFAGQYLSELNVKRADILRTYKRILASKYSLPAIAYRYNFGFKDEENAMCIGCLVMVDAEAGGVLYSRNPVDSKDDSIYVSSNWGLPKSVVDGDTASDQFVVSRTRPLTILDQKIHNKTMMLTSGAETGVSQSAPDNELQAQPSLNPRQIMALADLAIRLEEHFSTPQDIEWAIDRSGQIILLQSRHLQQIERESEEQIEQPEVPDQANLILSGGVTVNAGSVCGPAFVVRKGRDLLDFPPDSVLIAKQARPQWAPLLNRAVAVITEEGSFAGHLANVAREFGLPALFGLNQATEIIQNGDLITLDAGARKIYRGIVDAVLAAPKERKNLIAGSPVYQTLAEVSRLIVPLNLIDPDAPDFTPANCRSLHDITRFIHEKSVQEVFNFGNDHFFAERSSKQLVYNVPMQWWVLNLDDGFKKEVPGKRVQLSNINSIPMMALWDGMLAIRWDGPPLDGRGFMSVMFQGATNRAIGDRTRSRTADKNYFIISKNFCSLSSKLGFHFSTIESMVTDSEEENYISFMFKGGAADYQRRQKRIHFIGEILEDFGFDVKIKADALVARLDNQPAEYVKNRLKILGYLTIHSRQLDMIMTNDSSVNYYRNKFIQDMNQIIGSAEVPAADNQS